MIYTYKQAATVVKAELDMQAKLAGTNYNGLNVPCLLGPVGAGKTSMIHEAAEERGLSLVTVNCGDLTDPADLGIAFPNKDVQVLEWFLNSDLKRATQEPTMVLFDDVDKAPPHIQGALLGIAGARMVRDQALHGGSLVTLCGNRVSDDVLANSLSESLRTRATIIQMEPDMDSFRTFGKRPFNETEDQVHPVVLGYLTYAPKHLYRHLPEAPRFPTPRGWWEASRHLYNHDGDDLLFPTKNAWVDIVSRKLGEGVGSDFSAWHTIIRDLDIPGMLRGNVKPPAPNEHSKVYALIFALASWIDGNALKKTHVGLPAIVDSMDESLVVAFSRQLSDGATRKIARNFPAVATLLVKWAL